MQIVFPDKYYNSSLSVSEGDMIFKNDNVNKTSVLTWEIKKILLTSFPILKGNISHEKEFVKNSNILIVNCNILNYSITGFSITSFNVLKDKENINPFKGALVCSKIRNMEIIF